MIFLGLIAIAFLVFGGPIVGIFADEPSVHAVGVECLRIISYGYLFYAMGMVIVQAFNGAGDTGTPTKINFFCYWMFQIPLAYFLAVSLEMGPRGVFWAIAIAEALLTITGVLVFSRGGWKRREI